MQLYFVAVTKLTHVDVCAFTLAARYDAEESFTLIMRVGYKAAFAPVSCCSQVPSQLRRRSLPESHSFISSV
jgi:hypothetical protein